MREVGDGENRRPYRPPGRSPRRSHAANTDRFEDEDQEDWCRGDFR